MTGITSLHKTRHSDLGKCLSPQAQAHFFVWFYFLSAAGRGAEFITSGEALGLHM